MIAPIRPTSSHAEAPSQGVVSARRALAEVFFDPSARSAQQGPRVSNLVAWAFATAALAVATSYVARCVWWKIRSY